MQKEELIKIATELVNPKLLSGETISAEVGSALLTEDGNIYSGISIQASCGVGFCAEHSAIANMLAKGETRIKTIVAIGTEKEVLSPCGRCRELMYQVNPNNADTEILLPGDRTATLKELLPEHWLHEG